MRPRHKRSSRDIMRPLVSATIIVSTVTPGMFVQANGIPGTASTPNGYDTEFGTDPICWLGRGVDSTSDGGGADDKLPVSAVDEPIVTTPWKNKLVADFTLLGGVELLDQGCPNGTWIEGFVPDEFKRGYRPRTGSYYDYRVQGRIDLDNMNGDTIVSDKGPLLGVQVILCELGRVGFCSPFVHEQSNARLEAENRTVPVEIGDRHAETHVHSPTVFLELNATKSGPQEFDTIVPMLVNAPGSFFAIANIQLFTSDSASAPKNDRQENILLSQTGWEQSLLKAQFKYDVANALDVRLITYQDPAEILEVSVAVEATVFGLIGGATLVLAFLLFQTIKHRDNQVFKLSQGIFLRRFLGSAMVATSSTFLLAPKSDLYCNLGPPMVNLPLQFMYAIMIGRLWRINAVISPLLMLSLQKETTVTMRIFQFLSRLSEMHLFNRCRSARDPRNRQGNLGKSIRRTVSSAQLGRVIFLFTLPQIIVQVLSLTLQPQHMEIEFNDDESIGRTICVNDDGAHRSLEKTGTFLLLGLFFILLFMAHQSRKLPSLFNETESIYNVALVSILLSVIGLVIVAITNAPTTSPDVEFILRVSVVLSMTIQTSLRVLMPKLRMIWNGETVLVSKLVADHRAEHESKYKSSIQTAVGGHGGKTQYGLYYEEGEYNQRAKNVSANGSDIVSSPSSVLMQETSDNRPTEATELSPPSLESDVNNDTDLLEESSSAHTCPLPKSPSMVPSRSTLKSRRWTAHPVLLSHKSDGPTRTYIHVSDDETPPRRLLLRMVELHELLGRINQRIMSGLLVSHQDWDTVREASKELGVVFGTDVKFDWEEESNNSEADQVQERDDENGQEGTSNSELGEQLANIGKSAAAGMGTGELNGGHVTFDTSTTGESC